jgi:hypothetical protein
MKVKVGKKYARMQKFPTVSPQQQKILDKFARHIRPEQFAPPHAYNRAMRILEEGSHKIQPSPHETAGGNYLQNILQQGNQPGALEQSGSNYLQGLLSQDPRMMQQFEAPYMRQFNEQIVPGLAERFTGKQSGSAFQQALGSAGSGLMERLAALRGGLGMQAAQQALNYAQMPMQRTQQGMQAAEGLLPFAQLPIQRQQTQMQNAQALIGPSMMPFEAQNQLNQFAQNQQYQQRSQVLGTPPFGYTSTQPQPKGPGALASLLPGVGQGVGAAGGAWGMSHLMSSLGPAAAVAAV